MNMKNIIVSALMSAALVSSSVYAAGGRSGHRHPNLARAHREVEAAVEHLTKAQQANEFDLGGHAAKAKALLDQANAEIKQAVEQANDNKKK
jgi:outer membrane murein-binding lipoprotein Lpp